MHGWSARFVQPVGAGLFGDLERLPEGRGQPNGVVPRPVGNRHRRQLDLRTEPGGCPAERGRVGDRRGVAQSLETLAEVALARGSAATAGRLLGAATLRRDQAEATPTETESRRLVELGSRLERSLGAVAADHERHAGRTMPASAVLDLAARLTAVATAPTGTVELTARQLEVAALVAADTWAPDAEAAVAAVEALL